MKSLQINLGNVLKVVTIVSIAFMAVCIAVEAVVNGSPL